MDILVCFAVREEARFFDPPSASGISIVKRVTGMGRANAATALNAQLDQRPFSLVLTCGFAGGLNPRLARGAILFSADAASPLALTLVQLGAVAGLFHCADHVATTAAEKRALWQQTGADAVEMESQVIRAICRLRRIPSATIRVISDTADDDLPLDFNAMMTSKQDLDYFKLAGALLRSPGKLPALLELGRRTNAAARALGRCLTALLGGDLINAAKRPSDPI